MAKSPIAIVKEKFGDKEKLVAALEKLTTEDLWVSRVNANKGLAHVSNTKLLRLHATFTEVKEKFGTRAKLIDAILDLAKRTKDEGFKARISAYPVPRLYDLYKSLSKKGASAKKGGEKAAPKAAAKPKAEAKPKAAKKATKAAK
ncbi:MAG: hypothetical protein JNL38_38915 [Myxococcales bacterium]|jgi:hypothetical protein|nr:hypothetical protein [Myxococcales bacterium]